MVDVAVRMMTFEEFIRLPEEDVAYELVNGERVALMSPRALHVDVQGRLIRLLGAHLGDAFTGLLGPDLDLPTIPHCGRRPDIVYVAAEHMKPEDWDRGYPLCPPDLVIEVVSPGQEARDYHEKRHEYALAGIPHYWIVDPATRTIDVLVLGTGREYRLSRRLHAGDTLTSPLLPALSIPLRRLFTR